jgi:hypothetical protein
MSDLSGEVSEQQKVKATLNTDASEDSDDSEMSKPNSEESESSSSSSSSSSSEERRRKKRKHKKSKKSKKSRSHKKKRRDVESESDSDSESESDTASDSLAKEFAKEFNKLTSEEKKVSPVGRGVSNVPTSGADRGHTAGQHDPRVGHEQAGEEARQELLPAGGGVDDRSAKEIEEIFASTIETLATKRARCLVDMTELDSYAKKSPETFAHVTMSMALWWAKQNASVALREDAVDLLKENNANSSKQRRLLQQKLSDTKVRTKFLQDQLADICKKRGYITPPMKVVAKDKSAPKQTSEDDDDDEKDDDEDEEEDDVDEDEQRINAKRAEVYKALEPKQRATNDLNCQRALANELITIVELSRLMPFVPKHPAKLHCSVIYSASDNARHTVSLLDGTISGMFYEKRMCDAIVLAGIPIPCEKKGAKGRDPVDWPIVDALFFGTRICERINESYAQTSYTQPQLRTLVKALAASFFVKCGAALRASLFAAVFSSDTPQPPNEWFELAEQLSQEKKTSVRNKSLESAAKAAAKVFEEAHVILGAVTVEPIKSKSKPTGEPSKPKAAAVKNTSVTARKLADALKADAKGETVREPRLGRELFYEDEEANINSKFNHLSTPKLDELVLEFDAQLSVRTAEEAADAVGTIGIELNTTSTKAEDDDDGDMDLDPDIETDTGDSVGVIKKSDERLLDKIAAEASVSLMAVQFEYLKITSPSTAAGMKKDMPSWPQLTEKELSAVERAATKVREEYKKRSATTKRSESSLVAKRVTKPTQNSLTRVGPALSYPHSWTERQIDSVSVLAGDNWTYGEVMELRDQIKKNNTVSTTDALKVALAASMIKRQMKTTIQKMANNGEIYNLTMPLHNKVAVVRKVTEPGTGFSTWLSRCLIMQAATDALVQLCFTEVSKTKYDLLMSQIPNLPAGWSPLTKWTKNSAEDASVPVTDKPHVDAISNSVN